MNQEDCKCQLSVEIKMVPNGELTGVIGKFKPLYYIRHKTKMCRVEGHNEYDQWFWY